MSRLSPAFRVALAYAAFGASWIFGSDHLVEVLWSSPASLALAQRVKGLAFVALSTALVYFVTRIASRASERERQWFTSLFEASPDAMFVIGPEGGFRLVNDAAAEHLGYTREELLARGPLSLAPAARVDAARARLAQQRTQRARFQTQIVRKDGVAIDVDLVSEVVRTDGHDNILAVVRDITEQTRATAALAESEARFRTLVESIPEAIAVDIDGAFVWANPAAVDLLGAGNADRLLHTKVLDRVQAGASAAAFHVGDDAAARMRTTLVDVDQNALPVELALVPVRFDGRAARLIVIHDLRAARDAEVERERLVRAIEQSADAIFTTDPQGVIRYVNPAFERITGHATGDVIGATPRILKSGRHDESFYRELWASLRRGEEWRGTLINQKKDGTTFTADATIAPVRDDSGTVVSFVAVERDVTRERALATQLQQAQKMTAVGRLAGGVAHDFNNMLTVMLTVGELVLQELPKGSPLHDDMLTIHDAAQRAAGITQQLLAFARRERAAPRLLVLSDAIAESIELLRRLVDDGIVVRVDATPVWPVLLDPVQLDQVLTNLIVNARDAIGTIGTITIAAHNVAAGDRLLAKHPQHPGDFVALTVSDSGRGMDAATLAHIFEPFFTTKPLGRGTGLGLSTVFGVVEQNGGFIDVESSPGCGATFRIFFPRIANPDAHASESNLSRVAAAVAAKETILVVDDEVAVVSVCQRLLTRLGYEVLTASRPSEAVARVQAHTGPLHLVLTDVVMPEMTGFQLCHELRALRPSLPCLLMSGYPARDSEDERLSELPLLLKPFRADTLIDAVRGVLATGHWSEHER